MKKLIILLSPVLLILVFLMIPSGGSVSPVQNTYSVEVEITPEPVYNAPEINPAPSTPLVARDDYVTNEDDAAFYACEDEEDSCDGGEYIPDDSETPAP